MTQTLTLQWITRDAFRTFIPFFFFLKIQAIYTKSFISSFMYFSKHSTFEQHESFEAILHLIFVMKISYSIVLMYNMYMHTLFLSWSRRIMFSCTSLHKPKRHQSFDIPGYGFLWKCRTSSKFAVWNKTRGRKRRNLRPHMNHFDQFVRNDMSIMWPLPSACPNLRRELVLKLMVYCASYSKLLL